ncbi:segregation/condensation protein A [Geobacter pelophilus]|uniref:Segregation and condensation protein A n=1 Tax=Geoanaerobacter pelophilus TaxID=60036 RepID=A0AAW4LB01_9BACT|nr:segregation/condensation protein A [Geoanaerobacter pelophilus]MBT0664361.1 segregation/condensation protein A [Geoanaerobacter pelophilus]
MPGSANQLLFDPQQYSAYTVRVESFEGPLDLLLHLIKKNEVEICDIPIATITRQYLEYLELMKELNLEIAGEFLVMASTLLQIKSRMLLPATEEDEAGEVEELDPRAELIKRLMEYQRYKDAAAVLGARELLGRDLFARSMPFPDELEEKEDDQPLELALFDLVEAFRQVLSKVPFEHFHDVISETISVAERIGRILDMIDQSGSVLFEDLFADEPLSRELVIATFLALLELCRLKSVRVAQGAPFGSILLMRGTEQMSGEIDYVEP